MVRARARLVSGLVLLSFVLSHFAAHIVLIVSVPLAEDVLGHLMWFWQTAAGTFLLATALTVHVLNALWSIYIRRYLRMPAWELAQLCLGLSIPPLIMLHVAATKIADQFFDTSSDYHFVLMAQWLGSGARGILQMAAVLALWVHACIGLHFWLRTKRCYPAWRPFLRAGGCLDPGADAGRLRRRRQPVMREAQEPDFHRDRAEGCRARRRRSRGPVWRFASVGLWIYAGLVLLPFAGRAVRGLFQSMHRPPRLTHANGRTMAMLPGATVLETLRANGIPHASVCGGRARCTTCRIRVTDGLAAFPEPAGLEAAALARIGATRMCVWPAKCGRPPTFR